MKMNLILFLTLISINFIEVIRSDDEVFHWDAEIYPNLTSPKTAKFCTGPHRNPPSSVCDPELILRKDEALRLDQLIEDVQNDTKCFCDPCPPHKKGLEIKIAMCKFVKVSKNVSLERSVEVFAERTRRKWHFGGDCGTDVLIFFSAFNDKIYVSMGSKARKVLPEDEVNEILGQTKGHFTSGHYYQGLESIIASLQDLSQSHSSYPSRLGTGSIILIVICVALVVIILLFVVFWVLMRQKGNKKERKTLGGSFEFFGSWGRNKNKTRAQSTPRVRPKIEPIYKPVDTTDKPEFSDTTLPISDKQ